MFNKEYLKKIADGEMDDVWANVVKVFLWIGSLIYWYLIIIRHAFYSFGFISPYKFEQKVISVGNLSMGGVGKTPLVQYLAEYLNSKSKKAVVLMRGYMTRPNQLSDEAALLEHNVPQIKVLVGRNRVQLAKDYLNSHKADVFILDDGFQHLKIKRDLDILVIDCVNPWGNGFLLPVGILRERLPAIARAHIVVLTKVNLKKENVISIRQKIYEQNPQCLIVESIHQPTHLVDIQTEKKINLSFLQDRMICALSAIGSPDSFEGLLRNQGAVIEESYRFIDHHSFSRNDILNILQFCKSHQIDTVVTTQKDAVKLGEILKDLQPDIQFIYLSIQLKITKGEEDFRGRVDTLFLS